MTALAVLPNSDLVASGSGDGFIRLWRVVPQRAGAAEGAGAGAGASAAGTPRSLEHVLGVHVPGIITGLAFSAHGLGGLGAEAGGGGGGGGGGGLGVVLAASVGQEHRLGRWWRYGRARNGIAVVRLDVDALIKGAAAATAASSASAAVAPGREEGAARRR